MLFGLRNIFTWNRPPHARLYLGLTDHNTALIICSRIINSSLFLVKNNTDTKVIIPDVNLLLEEGRRTVVAELSPI